MNIDSFLDTIQTIGVEGYAFWSRKCSHNVTDNDEQNRNGDLGRRSSRLSRRYTDLLRKQGRLYQNSPKRPGSTRTTRLRSLVEKVGVPPGEGRILGIHRQVKRSHPE